MQDIRHFGFNDSKLKFSETAKIFFFRFEKRQKEALNNENNDVSTMFLEVQIIICKFLHVICFKIYKTCFKKVRRTYPHRVAHNVNIIFVENILDFFLSLLD